MAKQDGNAKHTMSDKPTEVMGSGCAGGSLGAVLGILIGGFVGPQIAIGNNHLHAFDACVGFLGMLLGAAIGGIVGGIGGSVFGAGLAAKSSSTPTEELPFVMDASSAELPERPTESPDTELARLKERIAELEEREQKDNRSKEEETQPVEHAPENVAP